MVVGVYNAVGVSVFEMKLRDGLNKRIDDFVSYMRQEYKRGREEKHALTNSEWLEKFRQWSEQTEVQRLAEEFILNGPE